MNFKQIFNFLAQLQVYNDRNWFNEHKDEYDEARATFETFVDALILSLSQLDTSIGTVTAADCMFRIYRDIRFSNDKTPYKTHFSAFIANGGRKTRMALHAEIHLPSAGSAICGFRRLAPQGMGRLLHHRQGRGIRQRSPHRGNP